MTVAEWLTLAEARLREAGVEAARLEAQLLTAHVLGLERVQILAHPEEDFPELAGESVLARREQAEPLAYILGWREFWGRRFRVGPGVLIPRHDTETLIEWALALPRGPRRVLDLGTGSGCIAITLKRERPEWEVTASDISPRALEIAMDNAESLGAEVRWVRADLAEGFADDAFDLVVSNPPYIGTEEPLDREVYAFEPTSALVSGADGLDHLLRMAADLPRITSQVAIEIGWQQGPAALATFTEAGWREAAIHPDLGGRDRMITARRYNLGSDGRPIRTERV